VAPPGAGKTRCALHVAAELERPLEVRVPTSALVQQWERRIQQVLVPVQDDSQPPPVRVRTYAGMAELADGALVVLDEAHHLGAAWGRELLGMLGGSHRVLGLTATPPVHAPGWNRFLEIVGQQPVLVETPPLVRDGHLCPYQDLLWPVLADLDDAPGLARVDDELRRAERLLGARLDSWVARRLREDLWVLTEERFARQDGLLVALCRHQSARGLQLPDDLPAEPELRATPTVHDRALLLFSFAGEQDRVKQALAAAGFRPRRGSLVQHDDLSWRALADSRSRIRGCLDLLDLEHRARGDGLRALVLSGRDLESDRLSARQVLKALVADARTDPLDPILVTGKAFWVDDDLWPRLAARLPELPWRVVGDHHEVDVAGWTVARRVELATRLLREGTSRCLVGTHQLLGEGWDCPPVNTVVDLTGIVAATTVNQLRGRALRPDPDDPSKVASLWEVITLVPGVSGGERMLERARARHEHTLGIDSGGRIRAGLGRMDPLLDQPLDAVARGLDPLRRRIQARVLDHRAAAERWAVGRTYRDLRSWRLDGRCSPPLRVKAHRPERPRPAGPAALALQRRRGGWLAGGLAAGGVALGGWLVLAGLPVNGPPAALVGLAVAAASGAGASLLWRRHRDLGIQQRAALEALAAALRDLDPELGALLQDEQGVQAQGPPASSRRFARAAAELLGPVRYPRYLLLETDGSVWPIPEELGARRDLADGFARHWAARVGPCEALYSRRGRGKRLLLEAWRAGSRAEQRVVECWE